MRHDIKRIGDRSGRRHLEFIEFQDVAQVGAGVRADISEFFVIGLEVGWRPVFSDDLDGVRYNGNPESGDWYYFAGLTTSFIISNNKKR